MLKSGFVISVDPKVGLIFFECEHTQKTYTCGYTGYCDLKVNDRLLAFGIDESSLLCESSLTGALMVQAYN